MDVIYCFGDSFSYRTPARDYEQFPIEEAKKKAQAKPKHQSTQQAPKRESKSSHSNCELCKEKAKERKKRPLKTEIKRCANRTESICEEAEES